MKIQAYIYLFQRINREKLTQLNNWKNTLTIKVSKVSTRVSEKLERRGKIEKLLTFLLRILITVKYQYLRLFNTLYIAKYHSNFRSFRFTKNSLPD